MGLLRKAAVRSVSIPIHLPEACDNVAKILEVLRLLEAKGQTLTFRPPSCKAYLMENRRWQIGIQSCDSFARYVVIVSEREQGSCGRA